MGFYLSKFVSQWILPPGSLILLMFVGLWLHKKRRALGIRLIFTSTALLVLLSLPVVAMMLMSFVEPYPALDRTTLKQAQAQAIVVLGGGRNDEAREYGGDTTSEITLERLRYGALVHQESGLPILVTGGRFREDIESEAELMRRALVESFRITPKWIEDESRNTAENASLSFRILEAEGIKEIYLVTHAWHMYRAVAIFRSQGFEVIPAPTAFEGYRGKPLEFFDFVPGPKALLKSYYALHELLGRVWYAIRY